MNALQIVLRLRRYLIYFRFNERLYIKIIINSFFNVKRLKIVILQHTLKF